MAKIKNQSTSKSVESEMPRKAKAIVKYLRISPRKVRLVVDAIRYQPVYKAFPILFSLKQKAARMTEKLLKSAVANAKVLGMDENRLYVSKIYADAGPMFKRFMSRSMGRADRILKRTTHLSMELQEGQKTFSAPQNLESGKEKETNPKLKDKKQKKLAGKK